MVLVWYTSHLDTSESSLVQRKYLTKIVEEEGQEVLGWRDVPTDNSSLGETAISFEPLVAQVFIKRGPRYSTGNGF